MMSAFTSAMKSSCFGIMLVVFAMSPSLRSIASNTSTIAGKVEPIEGGASPNGMFEVINVLLTATDATGFSYNDWHFEIRSKGGETLVSELSLPELIAWTDSNKHAFGGGETVLWRPNSRWVAISTRTSKFSVETIVFHWDGHQFQRVPMPQYEADTDNTFRMPYRWLKNGDLVLDLTLDHHTKSEPGGREYFATVGFSGNPPNGFKRSRTETIIDE
jgi:hypothetical protein